MARQHLIPASLLGGFSADTSGRRRDRRVWVARRGKPTPWPARARSLAFEHDAYTLRDYPGLPSDFVDTAWEGHERTLPAAIDSAAAVPSVLLHARDWITLVQLVAGLFVRNPDYAEADAAFLGAVFGDEKPPPVMPDNANIKRLIDYQWLSSTLLFCRWTLVKCATVAAVTNDNGFCIYPDLNGQPAAAVPLRPDLVLLVARGPGNLRAWWGGEHWHMEGFNLIGDSPDHPEITKLNSTLALTARYEIYGRSHADVEAAAEVWKTQPERARTVPPPQLLYPPVQVRQRIEMHIFHAMTELSKPPTQKPPWLLRFDTEGAWVTQEPES